MEVVKSPVLLIVFNRPDTTQLVFNAIKKAKPEKIYFAADAPRIGNVEDELNCSQVKKIIQQIDWECQAYYRYSDVNQGCGPGPFNAISWAFEKEDRLIILEDDCVAALPFFNYCNELLERYKSDTRIWLISGNQYTEEAVKTSHSYFFSRYGHSWGWATWKRCWSAMDMEMSKLPLIIDQDLYKVAFRTNKEASFFQKKIEKIYSNEEMRSHIWDFQFGFAITSNNGLCIVPRNNLVTNIGHFGTHSTAKRSVHNRSVNEDFKIISHPDFVLCDVNYDALHFRYHWNKKASILRRIIWKLSKSISEWRKLLK